MSGKRYILFVLVVLFLPQTTLAHAPIQGISSFFNGMLHPILVPAHLLLLFAIGLLLGKQGLNKIEPTLVAYAIAATLGLALTWFAIEVNFELALLALSVVLGLLITLQLSLPPHWCVLISCLAGFVLGIDSAQEQFFAKDRLFALFGCLVALHYIVLYPMALAESFHKKAWQQVGVRIAGAWIAAISLLVLALTLTPKP